MLFAIHALDKPGALDVRTANREAHLAYVADFDAKAGGPLLDDDGNMCGSLLIMEFADLAAAEEFAANDPYAIAGLFERVEIRGFKKVMWPQ